MATPQLGIKAIKATATLGSNATNLERIADCCVRPTTVCPKNVAFTTSDLRHSLPQNRSTVSNKCSCSHLTTFMLRGSNFLTYAKAVKSSAAQGVRTTLKGPTKPAEEVVVQKLFSRCFCNWITDTCKRESHFNRLAAANARTPLLLFSQHLPRPLDNTSFHSPLPPRQTSLALPPLKSAQQSSLCRPVRLP